MGNEWKESVYEITYDEKGNEVKTLKKGVTGREIKESMCQLCSRLDCCGDCFK